MAAPSVASCLACGEPAQKRDRRVLGVSGSESITLLWKRTIQKELECRSQQYDLDSLISPGPGYMCRKCHYSYEKLLKAEEDIERKATKAVGVVFAGHAIRTVSRRRPVESSVVSAPKRPRMSSVSTCSSSLPLTSTPVHSKKSPNVSVNLEYETRVRKFNLTPSRKLMGKAIARNTKNSLAINMLKDPVSIKYLLQKIGVLVRRELTAMCSERVSSILGNQSTSSLGKFAWKNLLNELSQNAPIFYSFMESCAKTRKPRQNKNAVIGLCSAMLLKLRSHKMSGVQKVISLILYAGHSGKQVYERLQKLNLTMSHVATNRLINSLGNGYDIKVKEWCSELTRSLKVVPQEQSHAVGCISGVQEQMLSSTSCSSSSSALESDITSSTISAPPFSPLTSDFSLSEGEQEESEMETQGTNLDTVLEQVSGGSVNCCASAIETSMDHSSGLVDQSAKGVASTVTECTVDRVSGTCDVSATGAVPTVTKDYESSVDQESYLVNSSTAGTVSSQATFGYKLVGDNIDKTVKPRFMRAEGYRNQSLHYFHSFAVRNRIDFSRQPDEHPLSCLPSAQHRASTLLPSHEDDVALRKLFRTRVEVILTQHMPFFKRTFDDIVEWHIKHQYYEEMSSKSEVVPLGVLLKDENKGSEMVDIMDFLHQFVPTVDYTDEVVVSSQPDVQTVPRATFHSLLFGGDHLTAARGRGAQRIRVNSLTPTARLEGLIPCAEDWHARMNLLDVIWKYFFTSTSAGDHGTLYQLRNLISRCNVSAKTPVKAFNECDDFFQLMVICHILAAALKYLQIGSLDDVPCIDGVADQQNLWMETNARRKEVLHSICDGILDKFVPFQYNEISNPSTDKVLEYGKQLLGVGCFYLEFADAVKEGDGFRVLRCWKYLLPLFKSSGRKNYGIEVLNMLYQYYYQLTPRQAEELIWGRFINTHGITGRNISADLHMEHLNRICKDSIHGLRSNKTDRAITRVGKSLGTLSPVLDQFDKENNMNSPTGAHRIPSFEKDRDLVLDHLQRCKVFYSLPGRFHSSVPKPRNILHGKSKDELTKWILEHV